ncbi:hypothetical protein C6P46_002403 [Rhodotorula mucilaginosa]|uniref:Enhancer of mRNA-decapping protein 3 n=1 Tax=Rhodotorula mucilaginosa TaxID=5537 RepID=A0A9P6W5Z7_RHOMI|nr:hypothetical protein C6P46_002403 [Rhodotorula mucilaginosa]
MATSFLGLPVLVKLRTGSADSVQGILSSLDPASGTLTLTEARSFVQGVNRLEGIRVLSRSEVAGLELLSVQRGNEVHAQNTSPLAPSPAHPSPRQPTQQQRPRPSQHPSPVPSPAHLALSERTPSGRSQKRRQQQSRTATATPARSGPHTPQPLGRIDDDFDFSAGLAAFDKKAVFADIKSQDATDPSSRLHAHNRNPSRARTPQSKLLPSESVLSPQELYDQQQEVQILRDNRRTKIASMTPTDMHAGDVEESLGAGGGGGGGGGPDGEDERRNERRWQSVTGELEKIALGGGASTNGREGVLRTAPGGWPVPVISAKQWREALSIAEIESSLTSTQRLEASASALLSHILSQRLVALPTTTVSPNSSPRPVVCLLSSDSDRGYIALRAAATLAYRGCRIFVLAQQQSVSSASQGASERFRTAIRVVSSAGARIVREVEDLPPTCALVIDALDSVASDNARESIEWANSLQKAYVLALDVPSGLDPDSGTAIPSMTPLLPCGILAFGLPRASLLKTEMACPPAWHDHQQQQQHQQRATITLADIGFPPTIWDRVGVEVSSGEVAAIWGAELLVEVERGHPAP